MNEIAEPTWLEVTEAIDQAVADVGNVLRSDMNPGQAIPGMDWTVADLAGHLVSLPGLYRSMFEDAPQSLPENGPAANAELLSALPPASLAERAGQLSTGIAELVDMYGDGSTPIPHWVRARPATQVGGIILNELVMHRIDLERALGRPTPISEETALICLAGLFPASPDFIDPEAALRAEGTFHTKLRGGGEWTQRVSEGSLEVESGLHGKPDLTILANPVAMLLVSQGRMGQVRANLTGRIIAYGRKPWKGLAFSKIFREL